jgi:hypothetical protein
VETLCGRRVDVDVDGREPEPEDACRACGADYCPTYVWHIYASTHRNNPQ